MSKITLKNLTKVFKGDVVAVRDLNIEVDEGIVTSILGPSGCGKTTTMRLIAGFENPTRGRIYFDSRDVTELTPFERRVGMVFQLPILYDDLSVYENIAMPLILEKKHSNDFIRKRVQEMCNFFDIPMNILSKRARGLDIAARQKISLAHAFIIERNVYLLDEPLSNLDPGDRIEIRSRLKSYQNEARKTIIYVTHDQTEAMSLAQKIAVMNAGTLLQYDVTETVYNRPRNKFVGWFLGNPGMNFLEGAAILVNQARIDVNFSKFGFSMPFSDSYRSIVENRGRVTVGIRPENIEVSLSPLDGFHEAICDFIEPVGNRVVLHLSTGGFLIRVKTERDKSVHLGQRIWFRFPPEYVLLFDSETGELFDF